MILDFISDIIEAIILFFTTGGTIERK